MLFSSVIFVNWYVLYCYQCFVICRSIVKNLASVELVAVLVPLTTVNIPQKEGMWRYPSMQWTNLTNSMQDGLALRMEVSKGFCHLTMSLVYVGCNLLLLLTLAFHLSCACLNVRLIYVRHLKLSNCMVFKGTVSDMTNFQTTLKRKKNTFQSQHVSFFPQKTA